VLDVLVGDFDALVEDDCRFFVRQVLGGKELVSLLLLEFIGFVLGRRFCLDHHWFRRRWELCENMGCVRAIYDGLRGILAPTY
jgi:hypothetical protein